MGPLRIEESVTIARSPDDVWAMVTDYSADHRWRPGIVEMTPDPPGPPAVGTRVREVLATGGRSYVTESTVTAVGPALTYRFSGSGTIGKVEGGRAVVAGASPATSVFTYTVELTVAGPMKLVRPLVRSTMRRGLRSDLVRLRNLLEQSPDAHGAGLGNPAC